MTILPVGLQVKMDFGANNEVDNEKVSAFHDHEKQGNIKMRTKMILNIMRNSLIYFMNVKPFSYLLWLLPLRGLAQASKLALTSSRPCDRSLPCKHLSFYPCLKYNINRLRLQELFYQFSNYFSEARYA